MVEKTSSKSFLTQEFTIAGDGTGDPNLANDYSATPTKFKVKPTSPDSYGIRRVNITINDLAPGGIPVLTNGITMEILRDGQVVTTFTPTPIMSFEDLLTVTSGVSNISFNPAKTVFVVYWDFRSMFSPTGFLRLDGKRNEELVITLHDDFSMIENICATVFGISTGELL